MKTESMMCQFRALIRKMKNDELLEAGIILAQNLTQTKREEFVQAATQIRSSSGEDDTSEKPQESKTLDIDKQKDDSSSASSENGF